MKCTLLILAALAASVAAAREDDADYLSAKLTPPWVDTTDSPTIELKAPPQPPNPPPPPKDGAIWGTFYPAAPPPPPPPPPPMPFPLAAAAGGGKASGTETTGSTGAPSFLQLLAADLAANPLTRLPPGSTDGFNAHFASAQVDPAAGRSLIQAHAASLAAAASLAPRAASDKTAATSDVDGSAGLVASLAAEATLAAGEAAAAAVDRAITSASAERHHHIAAGSVAEPSRHAAQVPIASLLQSSAVSRAARHVARKRAAQRKAEAAATEQLASLGRAATARATLSQAMALPRFASAALSAYGSRRAAAAAALRSAAHSAELAAAGALRGVGEGELPSAVGVAPPEGSTAETARFAGTTASRVLQHAGRLQRFRAQSRAGASADAAADAAAGSKTGAHGKATAGASTKAGTMAGFLPYFAHNYHSNPMEYPYNPFSMVSPHNYGPTGFGATTAAGPLYANFGYFPPSSQILKGTAGPLGDPDHPGQLKAGAATPDATDNGDPLDKPPPTGAYNPMAPPFFLRGTGWPFPYYMNPNTAPPAHLNPISAAHYAGRMSNVPVWRDW
ncbi:hypothetical protein FNF27_06290 [Cafeteria roenbergensis]|uniref:Uncharacterized protein n=1 Tax=Cafeteria roenbergensis TaxID=33653 RepID=A0A5A8E678_CAFRO|nr:hypothetical protein FNF27_06290 [Cafeteria roenbergensis]